MHVLFFLLLFFFFKYTCLRLDLALYVKKIYQLLSYVIFLIEKKESLYLKIKPHPLFQRTNTDFSVLLLASECGPLFYLLINLQFYFLSSMGEVRDSYQGSPQGSGGGQLSQRD